MREKIKGFSLIELSIVILILSVFLSTTVSFLAKKSAVDKNAITKERMERIAEALKIYFEKMDLVDGDASDDDGYIPCPANIAAALNNSTFGVGADNGSNCTQYLDFFCLSQYLFRRSSVHNSWTTCTICF
jgi:prepilin-type N-terminal cleavage/methylation domain-containing protein